MRKEKKIRKNMNVFIFIKSHELGKKANISIFKKGLFIIMYNGRHSTLIHFPKKAD